MKQKIWCRFCGAWLREEDVEIGKPPRSWDHEDVCWDCNEYGWKPVKKAGLEGLVYLVQMMIKRVER